MAVNVLINFFKGVLYNNRRAYVSFMKIDYMNHTSFKDVNHTSLKDLNHTSLKDVNHTLTT